ncbi:hypothetical protein KS4_30780 [Poriferisphaera corsica]|uniref:Tetratricopeptide repeat protein n=1 Tax=Poriferisphaera corsica TaxID=2528020 RepID=A0A517YXQ9_9BACT|nr:hypothetical protein [Poriferisphaera corsica]QDU35001.1 hypothetical protein KS4_30780 [Poriferisphaera corsica]
MAINDANGSRRTVVKDCDMKKDAKNLEFTPPRLDQVRDLFERNRPEQDSLWLVRLPLFVGVGVIVLLMLTNNLALTILLWGVFLGVFGVAMWRVRWMRKLEREGMRVDELAMRRKYVEALRGAWTLLPQARRRHGLYMRMANVIAHCLGELKCYEASAEAYDQLIERLPLEGDGVKQLRVFRAIAWLMEDRLADADSALRAMRGVKDDYKGTILGATVAYAELLQCVKTFHFEEGFLLSNRLLDDIRPMGIEAGYGHALMATCCYEMSKRATGDEERAGLMEKAKTWWRNAVCLMREEHLLSRLPAEVKSGKEMFRSGA